MTELKYLVKKVANSSKKNIATFAKMGIFTLLLALSSFSISSLARAVSATPITGVAGKCVDVQGGKATNGRKVQLYTCNSTSAQAWGQPGDGTIRNQSLCLDIQHGHLTKKTPVWLYTCNGSIAQQWKINTDGTLVNPTSGLCLDDMYGSTKDGNGLWLYTCNTSVAQKWTAIVPEAAAAPAPVVTTPALQSSTGDGYTNVDGNHVQSPSSNPQGATAQCGDGTYSYSQNRSGTCSHHGGVASWL